MNINELKGHLLNFDITLKYNLQWNTAPHPCWKTSIHQDLPSLQELQLLIYCWFHVG